MTSGNLAAQTDTQPPDAAQTDAHPPEATCANAASKWVAGANYKEGDAVISYGGFLWACKGGAATALCDDPGYEPDRNKRATEAWELRTDPVNESTMCLSYSYPEVVVDKVEVSSITCMGTSAVVTLTATVRNDSPAKGETTVAFYHSDPKVKIATVPIVFAEEDYEPQQISTVWRTSSAACGSVGSALITVVADDDGTGMDKFFEYNPDDNSMAVRLKTCPVPKPGPL
jgi:hypothetical protein